MDGGSDPVRSSGEDAWAPVWLCGLPLAPLRQLQVVDRVFSELNSGRGGWLVTANLDFAQRAATDPEARALYRRADLLVADGTPLLWAARLAGSPLPERVAGSDLVWLLAERAANEGRSLFLLGGETGVAERAAARLRERNPELRIVGWASPWIESPPTSAELEAVRAEIAGARPDLVYVALGSPKQEQVIDAIRVAFPGSWMLGCGISLSFIAGDVARAPRWLQRCGLEWAYRMVQEPSRLARRYLLKNLPFALRLLLSARSARD